MKRVRIGDLLEIGTLKGFFYAQVTHKHPVFGTLLRVLHGVYQARPSNAEFYSLVEGGERYFVFVPVDAGTSWGVFASVGNAAVPPHARKLPVFKVGFPQPGSVRVDEWRLWDGEREWPVGRLSRAQLDLPIQEIISPRLLVLRLESGWTPSTDATVTGRSPIHADDGDDAQSDTDGEAHFLYFRSRTAAQRAAQRLTEQHFSVKLERSAEGGAWVVRASVSQPRSAAELEDAQRGLQRLAVELGGDYDGWEAAVRWPRRQAR